MIRDAEDADAARIGEIYNAYVAHSVATFETEPVTPEAMAARIAAVAHLWLVFESGERIAGYAYAGAWKSRGAYRHTAECSVYVAGDCQRGGVGEALMRALLARLPAHDVHAVLAGIALPNPASIKLHEKLGFEPVAHFKETGRKFERWIDVGYWQMRLPGP